MSRIAKYPVPIPAGVEVNLGGDVVTVKGKKGSLQINLHPAVEIVNKDNVLTFAPRDQARLRPGLSPHTGHPSIQ